MANILICDDERDIVSALKIYLSSEGYTLFEAYTGREALEIARKNPGFLVAGTQYASRRENLLFGQNHSCKRRRFLA